MDARFGDYLALLGDLPGAPPLVTGKSELVPSKDRARQSLSHQEELCEEVDQRQQMLQAFGALP